MAGTREIAQRNGLLGGRPKGTVSTPFAVKQRILEMYRKHADMLVEEELRIATKGKFEPTRLQAIHKVIDHLIGKPVQPNVVDSAMTLTVITGVPRASGFQGGFVDLEKIQEEKDE